MSKIRLHGSSSGYTEIAPVAASGNNTLTLPNDGTIISKDSAGAVGVTSVVTDAIKVGAAVTIGESGVNVVGVVTATSGIVGLTSTGLPSGSIIQVKQTLKTDTFSTNVYGYTNITGLSVSITPTSSSNKILIIVHLTGAGTLSATRVGYRVFKDGSTAVGSGDASGNRITGFGAIYHPSDQHSVATVSASMLDTPGDTSSHTYQVQTSNLSNSSSNYINRSESDSDNYYSMRSCSSITVMELAA